MRGSAAAPGGEGERVRGVLGGKAVPTIPKTGDNSSVTLLFALLLLSGGAYLGMAASKKAKQ